jgi:hypothetical protein
MRALGLVAVAMIAGCFGQKDTLGLQCDFDSQCDLGQDCVQGTCVERDDTGSDGGSTGCMASERELAPLPSRIVLVVDRSAAMADAWDHDGDPGTADIGRLSVVTSAIADAIAELDPADELGLVLAPSDATCSVDAVPVVPLAAGAGPDVVSALPDTAEGGAPLGPAIASATAALTAASGPGPRAIALVLAGAPGCLDAAPDAFDAGAVDAIGTARQAAIPTVVVGVAPSEVVDADPGNAKADGVAPAVVAIDLAEQGGRPRPSGGDYRAANGVTLGPTLHDALFAARGCVLPRPEGITAPSDVVLRIDGEAVPRRDACDDSGFVVRADAIELCGSWCDALKLGGSAVATVACG